MVPEGFHFPSRNIHLKLIWDLWWNGNAIEKIGPYRKLRASDLAFKTDKVPLSKASFLMKELTKISEENQLLGNQSLRNCSIADRDRVFKTSFPVLLQRIFPE